MRDFADSTARPFSQAKDDDLVDLIRNIIGGKDEKTIEPKTVKKKKKREDEEVDEFVAEQDHDEFVNTLEPIQEVKKDEVTLHFIGSSVPE